MKFADFKSSLRKKPLARNYCFFGPDSYLLNQARDALLKVVQESLGAEIRYITLDVGDVQIDEVLNAAWHVPMFTSRQMILVKSFMKLREPQAKRLEEYLRKPNDQTILVFWAGELAREERERRVFKILEVGTELVELAPLEDEETIRWIGSKFKAAGLSIEADAIDLLHQSQGNSLERLSHEIEKLILLAGTEKNVTASMVAQSAGFDRDHNINEFLTAVFSRDKPKALQLLNEMATRQSELIPVISLLSWQLRQLLQMREMSGKLGISEIARQVGVYNRSVAERMITQSQRFSVRSLTRAISGLAALDDRVKRSSLDTKLFAELLVHQLTNQETP
jgi:DNA polymerase-3 subunit delta